MSHRRERIAQDLLQRLAHIVEHRVSDPRLEGVTLIEVRVAPDASFARVFYRARGDRAEVERALRKAKSYIRRCLARDLPLRRVPELDFRYDPSEDQAARVEEILRELEPSDGDPAEEGGDGGERLP